MEENFDEFISSQQHTTGSEETLEQSFTEEKQTEQTTPKKLPKRMLSIDEQEEIKNSPQKKVLAETSKHCLSDQSTNNSSPQSTDDECILEVTPPSCKIKETVSKPEESDDYLITTPLKTEEFFKITPISENSIDDTTPLKTEKCCENTPTSETPIDDEFSSLQQHTNGTEKTLEQSFTEEKETEQATHVKLLKRTLSIDEQEETKNSPHKKVLAETSKHCFSDESTNNSSSKSMDDECILEVTPTSCKIKEAVSKPEESGDYLITTSLKTGEFCKNTPTSENPIDDEFSSLQQHTNGSEVTLEQSFTEEKQTEQTTPKKFSKRTLSIDEQEEIKNSPHKKVLAETSKHCLSDESTNNSSPQSMDDECILKVTPTSCAIKETVSKPEENEDYSITKALKTEQFGENTSSSENPIDDTKEDQTSKYDFSSTDQTSSETPIKDLDDLICEIPQTSEHFLALNEFQKKLNMTLKSDCLIDIDSTNQNTVYTDKSQTKVNQNVLSELFIESFQNGENSSEEDNLQDKLHYSEAAQNLPETIQGNLNLKSQGESEILNFPSEGLESENDSSALSKGKEILKAKYDSAHDCKRDSDSDQTKPNFDCKLSRKIKKPLLEKEENICIKEFVKRHNSNSDCTDSMKKILNVSKQTSSHSKAHNFALHLQPSIIGDFKKVSKVSEKTTDKNKVLSKISQSETNPEGKYSVIKSIKTYQITESSELSEQICSDSRDNTEMGDNPGIAYSKLHLSMPSTLVASPELPYFSEISRESDDSTSPKLKNSEFKDSQTKGVYKPSIEYTESVEISENSCGLNTSKKSQNIAEEHHSVKSLTSSESREPKTSYTSVSELDEQGKSDESIESGENTAQNISSNKNSSKQSELPAKADEISAESASVERSSGSETFSLNMGAVITDVINEIVRISFTFDFQTEHWTHRHPVIEINIPENTQTPSAHESIVETFNCIHRDLIRIANTANNSVENILDRIRALRPHMNVLMLVGYMINTMQFYLRELKDVSEMVFHVRSLCGTSTPYRNYYREFCRSVVSIYRAFNEIIKHLQRIGSFHSSEHA